MMRFWKNGVAVAAAALLMAGCNNTYDGGEPDAASVMEDGWSPQTWDGTVRLSFPIEILDPLIVSGGHVARSQEQAFAFSVDPEQLKGRIAIVSGVLDGDGDGEIDGGEPGAAGFAVANGSRYINPANAMIARGYAIAGNRDFDALVRFGPNYDFDAAAEARKSFAVYKALSMAMVTVLASEDTTIPLLEQREADVAASSQSSGAAASSQSSEVSITLDGSASSPSPSSESGAVSSYNEAQSSSASSAGECDFGPCADSMIYVDGLSFEECDNYGGVYDRGECGFDSTAVLGILQSSSSSDPLDEQISGGEASSQSSSVSTEIYLYSIDAAACGELSGIYDFSERSCLVSGADLSQYFGDHGFLSSEARSEGESASSPSDQLLPSANATARSARQVTVAAKPSNKEKILQMMRECEDRPCLDAIVLEAAAVRNGVAQP